MGKKNKTLNFYQNCLRADSLSSGLITKIYWFGRKINFKILQIFNKYKRIFNGGIEIYKPETLQYNIMTLMMIIIITIINYWYHIINEKE